ncbi:hypothetical protein E4U58_003519, partial [Claviceps cyperi]
ILLPHSPLCSWVTAIHLHPDYLGPDLDSSCDYRSCIVRCGEAASATAKRCGSRGDAGVPASATRLNEVTRSVLSIGAGPATGIGSAKSCF